MSTISAPATQAALQSAGVQYSFRLLEILKMADRKSTRLNSSHRT